MLLLTSASDLLHIVTADATPVDVHASWVDNAAGTITPGRTNTAITSATTTTVVASPAASAQRNVKLLSVCNKHATNAALLSVYHTDGTVDARLIECELDPGSSLVFVEGEGWELAPATLAGVDITGLATSASVTAAASTAASATAAAIVTAEAYADTLIAGLVPATRTVNGHALSSNVTVTAADLGLGTLATQSGTFSGTSSGTNTGDQTSVAGNAGTATALATARAINGVNFDGTADVTVTAAAGTVTGATLAANVLASSLTSVGTLTSLAVVGAITSSNLSGTNTGDQTSITGNAETVTTNANLTGPVTSSGNATAITAGAVTLAMLANLAQDQFIGRTTASTGVPQTATITAAGRALIDDADATAQRTTLGLGTLATQSGTFSGTSSGTNTGDQTSVSGNAGTATALATPRAINGVDFDGTAAITIQAVSIAFGGRLSLATATSVMTANVLGSTTIYYTPHIGSPSLNRITIWDGSKLVTSVFTELTNVTTASSVGKAGPAAVAASSVYDLFVWNDAGTIRLTRGPAWTSGTARGAGAGTTQLDTTTVPGLATNAVAITNGPGANLGTYVGTVVSNASSTIDWQFGSIASTYGQAIHSVWNMYNRTRVVGFSGDTTDSWGYQVATIRASDNSANARVSYACGLLQDPVQLRATQRITSGASTGGVIGFGVDSASAFTQQVSLALAATQSQWINVMYAGYPGIGSHFVSLNELAQNTTNSVTFFGDGAAPTLMQGGFWYDLMG